MLCVSKKHVLLNVNEIDTGMFRFLNTRIWIDVAFTERFCGRIGN